MAAIVIAGGKSPIVLPASQPGSPGATGPSGLSADGYPTRSAMAARSSPAVGDGVYLLEAGREGKFVVDLASNWTAAIAADTAHGVFVASTADATKVYRRVLDDHVNPLWFGILTGTGNGTANSAAILAMFAALRALATNANSTYQGTIPVHFPAGYYEFASTIDLTDGTFIIEGAGCDFGITGAPATLFKFPAGVTGIRVQRYNTSGATSTRTAAKGADGSVIRRIALQGAYTTTEGSTYGIHLRANAFIEQVAIMDFEGDGIYSIATAGGGGAGEGNANNTRVVNSAVLRCRNGIFIDGADTNIWAGFSLYLAANRQWGLWDSSFLGNNHFSYQADANGLVSGSTPSVVSYLGNRYCVKFGQETGASTNAPSGTTADNTWWYYMGAGGVSSGNNINTWTSGTTYRSGGSFLLEGSGNANNVLSGCYHEGGSGLAQNVTQPTLVCGGNVAGVIKGACLLGGDAGGNLRAFGPMRIDGNITGFGATNQMGPQSGTAADLLLQLYNTNVTSQINGISINGNIGNIYFNWGSGTVFDVANAAWTHKFKINGTEVVRVTSTGLTIIPLTVTGLGAAGTAGRRSFVSDATATTFASVVAGGGTNKVPVYDDGTNWRIG